MGTRKAPPEQAILDSAKAALNAAKDDSPWQRYRCKLVTPMYGGGVDAGKVDDKMPIRATSIRGQLRFWWRLLNRKTYLKADGSHDHKALFEAEREVWGGLGTAETIAASKVLVQVKAAPIKEGEIKNKDGSPIGKMIITEAKATAEWLSPTRPFEFDLEIKTDICVESVQQAIRMWASFGGIGARRRRGLGAVEVFDQEDRRVLAQKSDIEASGSALYFMDGTARKKYRDAVEDGVLRMIEFRQQPNLARGAIREGRPGGSYWPEANAVRNLTRRARQDNHHALSENTPLLFPRALLGLPIVFQFKLHERQGDPHTATLELSDDKGVKRDRFASPLIFSAWPDQQGNNTVYRSVLLLLPTHADLRKQALKLKISDTETRAIPAGSWWPVDAEKRKAVLPKRLVAMAGKNSDVLTAFINYFRKGDAQP